MYLKTYKFNQKSFYEHCMYVYYLTQFIFGKITESKILEQINMVTCYFPCLKKNSI